LRIRTLPSIETKSTVRFFTVSMLSVWSWAIDEMAPGEVFVVLGPEGGSPLAS